MMRVILEEKPAFLWDSRVVSFLVEVAAFSIHPVARRTALACALPARKRPPRRDVSVELPRNESAQQVVRGGSGQRVRAVRACAHQARNKSRQLDVQVVITRSRPVHQCVPGAPGPHVKLVVRS